MIVTTVYTSHNGGKGGTCYSDEWLGKILNGVDAHLSGPLKWRPLTDLNLTEGWPGWWAKMELFKPGQFDEPVLFMDLDTLVVGDLTDIASYPGDFAILRDFYHPQRMQSSVMMWRPGPVSDAIWERFIGDPKGYMKFFRSDQEFIEDTLRWQGVDYWQDLYPDQIVSLKVHALPKLPKNARLVCAHGEPRLNDPASGWAHTYWNAL